MAVIAKISVPTYTPLLLFQWWHMAPIHIPEPWASRFLHYNSAAHGNETTKWMQRRVCQAWCFSKPDKGKFIKLSIPQLLTKASLLNLAFLNAWQRQGYQAWRSPMPDKGKFIKPGVPQRWQRRGYQAWHSATPDSHDDCSESILPASGHRYTVSFINRMSALQNDSQRSHSIPLSGRKVQLKCACILCLRIALNGKMCERVHCLKPQGA